MEGLSPIEAIIEDMRQGKMVILVDDEDRENEGDLMVAATCCTSDHINFMARHGRGLICLTLTEERCKRLNLPLMVHGNGSRFGTNFTLSIEAAKGVTTGISAQDRATTIQAAVAPDAKADDIVQPGHIFPIMAKKGGVLVRAGHTEAGCDLARLAGFEPAAVICEILKENGEMARLADLIPFAQTHNLKIGTIADLIRYRNEKEQLVHRVAERLIQTEYGQFRLLAYEDEITQEVHLALTKGVVRPEIPVLVRVHEPLALLDLLENSEGGHSWSVPEAMRVVAKEGLGVILLLQRKGAHDHLIEQVRSPQMQEPKMDVRTYGLGAQILRDLGVGKMRLLSTPRKLPSMAGFGLEIVEFIEKAKILDFPKEKRQPC